MHMKYNGACGCIWLHYTIAVKDLLSEIIKKCIEYTLFLGGPDLYGLSCTLAVSSYSIKLRHSGYLHSIM